MKKFLLAFVLVLTLCPLPGLSQATIGYHRINQVLARAPQSVTAQVVPYAKVSVTDTTTGLAATIYSDPLLTALISPPVVTADANGNYDYYIPLSYCVTESITSPGQGIQNISNICSNGVNIPVTVAQGGTGATTAAGANLNITGVTQTGTLGTSSQVSTFPGTVAAGTIVPTNPLDIGHGGTGATTAAGALTNLGAAPLAGANFTGALNGTSASFSGTVAAGTTTTGNASNVIIVDGTVYPQTAVGIQSAINAAPAFGSVFLASGSYSTTTGLPILITKGVTIEGAGRSTVINITGASASTDVFLVRPPNGTTPIQNVTFSNFWIHSTNTTSGRYGIHFDATNDYIAFANVSNMTIDQTVGQSIYAAGGGPSSGLQGSLLQSDISNNPVLGNGFQCTQCGDTVRVQNNSIRGALNGVDMDFVPGASTAIISGNNIVVMGGAIHLGALANHPQIYSNEIENLVGATGSNGALVDVDGASGGYGSFFGNVYGNTCQIINASTLNCLRLNYAQGWQIYGNTYNRGATGSTDIVLTANSAGNDIGTNVWAGGFPLSAMIVDSGTSNVWLFQFEGNNVVKPGANQSFTTINAAGTGFVPGIYMFSNGDMTVGSSNDYSDLWSVDGYIRSNGIRGLGMATPSGLYFLNNGHISVGYDYDFGFFGVDGDIANANNIVIPSTALGYQGPAAGYVQLSVSGTTGTITGTALTATCDSGTATVTGAVVGHPVAVSSTTGADVIGAFNVRASVTATGVVTVYVCGTGTPPSLAYNVTVF